MRQSPYVLYSEYKKHLDGDWRTVHNLWRKIRNYAGVYGYSKTEVDAFFEGESGGKKQVDAGNVIGLTQGSIPFAAAGGALTEANADFNYNSGTKTLSVDTMAFTGGSLTDSSGAISFGNENLITTGTFGSGTITVKDGSSINLQEDLTFTGATGVNLIKFPDNLPDALSFKEAGNAYLTFVSTNGSEKIIFGAVFSGITGSTIGNLTLADGSITDSGGAISFDNENLITNGTLTLGGIGNKTSGNLYLSTSSTNSRGTLARYGYYSYINMDSSGTVFWSWGLRHDGEANQWVRAYTSANNYLPWVALGTNDKIYFGGAVSNLTTDTNPTTASHFIMDMSNGNLGFAQLTFGTNATKTLALGTGVAPTTSPADCFQIYSADIGGAAGKAGPHFRDEEGNIISIGSGGMLATLNARWINTLWIDAGAIKAPGAKPATEIPHGILETPAWQFADQALEANQETISYNMRIPNRMDRTVAPTMSIGWSADGISPGNCEWQLEYLWTAPGEDTGAAAQETLTAIGTATVTPDGLVVTTFTGIDLPGATDACIHCRVKRLSAGGNDTIVDTTELHGVCLNWTSNKLGTAI